MDRPGRFVSRSRHALAAFLETEASGGIVLVAAALAAMLWANLLPGYDELWHREVSVGPLTNDLRHWVNDGLMTVFFFVVGLEIKRELVLGELRDVRVATLPMIAAIGGMGGPALVYLAMNSTGDASRGWAIPMATDIAFVVGVLALLGRRAPTGLKLFLLTLAIVDDIGAIVVIAVVYSTDIDARWIGLAGLSIVTIVGLRSSGVVRPIAYALPAFALWLGAFNAGVHPTLAGVLLGLLTPAREVRGRSVLEDLERRLHPLSSHLIVPIFALANAGVALTFAALSDAIGSRIFWGVVVGLVIGKLIGVFGASRVAEMARLGRRPHDVGWTQLAGGAALSGIGFTVAIFVAGLAFESEASLDQAKLGVLAGTATSAMFGVGVLFAGDRRRTNRRADHP